MRIGILLFVMLISACTGTVRAVIYADANRAAPDVMPDNDYRHLHFEHADHSMRSVYVRTSQTAKANIVFLHGGGQAAVYLTHVPTIFNDNNYNFFLPEYSGHFGEPGQVTTRSIVQDVQGAVAFARGQGDSLPVILMGFSKGASIAALSAPEAEIDGLITLAAFTSLREMQKHRVPMITLPQISFETIELDALSSAPHVGAPWQIVHCVGDPVIPSDMGRALAEASRGVAALNMPNCSEHLPPDSEINAAIARLMRDIHNGK